MKSILKKEIQIVVVFLLSLLFMVSCVSPSKRIDFPTPSNGGTVYSDTVILQWDHFEGFEYFAVRVGESAATLTSVATTTQNQYELKDLRLGRTYYWQVEGFKEDRSAYKSDVWSFNSGGEYAALLTGVTDYSRASDLKLTDDDAEDMKVALEATVFDYNIDSLLGEVTKETVQDYITTKEKTGDESVFTFFYAGHGGYSGGESYLYYSDGSTLPVSRLKELLDTINGRKLVIIDACNSGGFTDLSGKREITARMAREMNNQFNAEVIDTFKNTKRDEGNEYFVMTASNISQSSWENTGLQNGVFSFFLLDGIGDVGLSNPEGTFDDTFDADANENGEITLKEAYDYASPLVDEYVREISDNDYHQTVQVYPVESDFIVSKYAF